MLKMASMLTDTQLSCVGKRNLCSKILGVYLILLETLPQLPPNIVFNGKGLGFQISPMKKIKKIQVI
jgi:hypothetical protein